LAQQPGDRSTQSDAGFYDIGTLPGRVPPRQKYVDWLTIAQGGRGVLERIHASEAHPLVPSTNPVYGYIYDVAAGRLIEVRRRGGRRTGPESHLLPILPFSEAPSWWLL
jgi:hypothetical protein